MLTVYWICQNRLAGHLLYDMSTAQDAPYTTLLSWDIPPYGYQMVQGATTFRDAQALQDVIRSAWFAGVKLYPYENQAYSVEYMATLYQNPGGTTVTTRLMATSQRYAYNGLALPTPVDVPDPLMVVFNQATLAAQLRYTIMSQYNIVCLQGLLAEHGFPVQQFYVMPTLINAEIPNSNAGGLFSDHAEMPGSPHKHP